MLSCIHFPFYAPTQGSGQDLLFQRMLIETAEKLLTMRDQAEKAKMGSAGVAPVEEKKVTPRHLMATLMCRLVLRYG